MGKRIDLTGQRFGRLTVIEFAGVKNKRYSYWKCRCDCGSVVTVYTYSLTSGKSQSCGCLHNEITAKISARHNLRNTKIYRAWRHMNHRCFNANDKNFSNYGGRGITVCDEWRTDFVAFYNYVSKLAHFDEKGYSLDRINNNGNYEPGNVRWATRSEQSNNRRNNIVVEYGGKEMTLTQAAELSGIKFGALQWRYKNGWRDEKLFQPVR